MSTTRRCDRCDADVTEQAFIKATLVDCSTMEREGKAYDICIDCVVWWRKQFEKPCTEGQT